MSWALLDDNFPNHPKVLDANHAHRRAADLFICGLCYSAREGTAGFIPTEAAPALGCRTWRRSMAALVEHGLWRPVAGGWEMGLRAYWKIQRDRQSLSYLLPSLILIHGAACVYCGIEGVPFEVEHIVPVSRGGRNVIDNLTVSCVECNRRKGTKTAAEFGFPHLHIGARCQPIV